MNLFQRTFGEIANLRNGVNYIVADQGALVKVVGVGDFQDRTELSSFDILSQIRLRSHLSSDDELQDGDLLFVRSNGNKNLIGRCMVIRNPPAGTTFSGFTIRARLDKSQALPDYISLVFQTGSLSRQMTLAGGGNGNISNLNQSLLATMPVSLPSLEIQKVLVSCISAWDTAIQKTEQLIAAKERRREALTQRLYTFSDSKGKPSRFSDLLSESMESGSSGRHARKITVKLYGKGVLAKEEKRHGSEQTQYFVRRAGQLIYSKLDFLNGAFGIIPPELEGYESTLDLPAFDIAPTVNPVWLLGYLTRPKYYTRQVGLARGQRKARRVHPSDLLASSLHVPPRNVQDRIAEILISAQCDIDKSKRLLESLKTQKRGLMQKLLTGQWRLPPTETTTQETAAC